MHRLVLVLAASLSSLALAADAFPWEGAVTLTTTKGEQLSWTVTRVDGEVRITGSHPKWSVEHRAKPNGTPIATVRKANGLITNVKYTADGAEIERVDAKGNRSITGIKQAGLWDGDTLDARLAGVSWAKGKKVRMQVVDVDKDLGEVYPMVAEYVGAESCGQTACHRVHLALDDFRRLFAPTFEYRYGSEAGAKYLQFEGDGLTFVAR